MQLAKAVQSYREFLSRQGMLFTKERLLILQSVFSRSDHFSADDLLFYMHGEGLEVSRATLYRNLKLLAQAGILVEADFGHGHIHYELASGNPHEHLVCTDCGKVLEVNTAAFSEAVQSVADSQGFTVTHHLLKIFGRCADCRKK